MENKGFQNHSLIETPDIIGLYSGPDRIISSTEAREKIASQPKAELFATGFRTLDETINGLEAGELISIGGPTKHGKTLLAQTITVNLTDLSVPCLWFTFEVPVPQFMKQMPEKTVFYLPAELKIHDIDWIKKRVIESSFKFQTKVIFIDNLHHLFDISQSRNTSLDIGNLIRQLKRLAIGTETVIFLLCHSRKPSDASGQYKEQTEWDLRDSSFIPQESDSTWMIQRRMNPKTMEFSDAANLRVCNHRRTGAMGRTISLRKRGSILVEENDNGQHNLGDFKLRAAGDI